MREAFTATADSSLSRIFAISAFERLVLQSSISLATSVSDHLMEVVLAFVCAAALELVATIEGSLAKNGVGNAWAISQIACCISSEKRDAL